MNYSPKDITVVILSYNSKEVTDTCLTKLKIALDFAQKKQKNTISVIVVDNASKDGSVPMIQKKHPWVELMALTENIGYAKGNNLAMSKAHTPYILLMNSDTYIQPEDIDKLITKLINRPECAVLVGRCVYANGVLQQYGGFLPTPVRIGLWAFGAESMPLINTMIPRIYGFETDYYSHEGTMEWTSPNYMLIKREVFTQTQGFDEHLWFHMVDCEWCKRIRDKGFIIGFTPEVEVIHLGGASSKGLQAKLLEDNFKGLIHFCQKHYTNSLPLLRIVLRWGLTVRGIVYAFFGKKGIASSYFHIARSL